MSGLAMESGEGTRVDLAVRRVRDHIRVNDLKVGDTLPAEGYFASELGVSRAVMREAFGALAALRLIDVGNGRRARVGAIDGSVMGTSLDHAVATAQVSLAEVWDVRRTLELRTVEMAATNRTEEAARRIVEEAAGMRRAGNDLAGVVRHDIAFHQTIARASGNALFLQIIRSFEPLMRVAVPTAWRTRVTDEQKTAMFDCHALIADAILCRDAPRAIGGMNQHFDASIGDLFAGPDSVTVI